MKSRWGIYFKERFPILPNLLVAGGIVESARRLAGTTFADPNAKLSWIASMAGGILFLAQLRLMDEYKDFEKDKIAHPDRPLPRGLFTPEEFAIWIRRFNLGMAAIALMATFLINLPAGIAFAGGVFYLYLMFREFFMGTRLQQYPMIYAITHQLIIFPMGLFVYFCFRNPPILNVDSLWFCTYLLGTFFGFEVGRKLDPHAHPILKTYLTQYGRNRTAMLLYCLLGIAVYAGERIGVKSVVGPFYIWLLLVSSLIWWSPARYKIVEGTVALFLLLALWAIPISRFFGGMPT
jgi:4-hydroxybenzoate polyprenyltransferase